MTWLTESLQQHWMMLKKSNTSKNYRNSTIGYVDSNTTVSQSWAECKLTMSPMRMTPASRATTDTISSSLKPTLSILRTTDSNATLQELRSWTKSGNFIQDFLTSGHGKQLRYCIDVVLWYTHVLIMWYCTYLLFCELQSWRTSG